MPRFTVVPTYGGKPVEVEAIRIEYAARDALSKLGPVVFSTDVTSGAAELRLKVTDEAGAVSIAIVRADAVRHYRAW